MNTKLIFAYDPNLTSDVIISALTEACPDLRIEKWSDNFLNIKKNDREKACADIKIDENLQQITIEFTSPSQRFADELALSLKTKLAVQYHFIEEARKSKLSRALERVLIIIVLIIIALIVCIMEEFNGYYAIQEKYKTRLYIIEADKLGLPFKQLEHRQSVSYIDHTNTEVTRWISKDSTYFYNTSSDPWLLYSIDYMARPDAVVPERIFVIIPPNSLIGHSKIDEMPRYLASYTFLSCRPDTAIELSRRDIRRGYKREYFIQEYSRAIEVLSEFYPEKQE